ncbi:MFS transporter [Pseudohalioglobus sediminis]|uniref:MFS transporter n=1 Tax=Pseudohalioglobus sediminis TaxID=2606449 RepID=A0A5B0X1T6_9GAMM|nr:MFS transporter [Pseudohalioglobus sediminis]KAA1192638.1 MFS transporter [Pseudohalioglobus sediminis]
MGEDKYPEFRLGWPTLLVALSGVITSAHFLPLYSFGPMAPDLSRALNIPLGELQRCITLNFAGIAVGSQLAGWLMDRFSLRSVTLCSLVLYALTYITMSTISLSQNLLYTFYFLLPIVGSGSLLVTWTKIVCDKFERQRGLALAILLSGSGVVSTVSPLLLAGYVGTADWQQGFLVMGILPLATLLVCFFTLPTGNPSSNQQSSLSINSSEPENGRVTRQISGISYRETLRSRQFWTIIVALILVVFVVVSMITNIVPMLVQKGLSQSGATVVFSAFGLALVAGRLAGGFFLDKFWGPLIAFCALVLPSIGCLIFLLAPPDMVLMVMATVLVGVAAGAEFDILAYLVSRYFGLRSYAKVFGTVSGTVALGSGMSPLIFGPLIDATGNYDSLLLICIVIAALGASMFLTLGPYPDFEEALAQE